MALIVFEIILTLYQLLFLLALSRSGQSGRSAVNRK